MGYHSWTVDGYGICVDDIETTTEKILKLASMKPGVLKDVREYLDEYFDGQGYMDETLTMEVFDDLVGDYFECGVAYILCQVIDEITVEYADDYNGTQYILYTPTYPWKMDNRDKSLKQEDVEAVFRKYVSVLTDKPIKITYYSVENGG